MNYNKKELIEEILEIINSENSGDSHQKRLSEIEDLLISQDKNMSMKHKEIFDKYLDDKCPVCDGHVDSDSNYSHTESGGKCVAKYFSCNHCHSEYTVGYNRSSFPIESEITISNLKVD